jgi:hypothetical protein
MIDRKERRSMVRRMGCQEQIAAAAARRMLHQMFITIKSLTSLCFTK